MNAYSVQQSSDGGYIFTGQSGGYAWLVKTDADGSEMWNKTFKGKNSSSAYSVRQTLIGSYIIGGWTKKNQSNDYYGWLIKADSNGNKQWDKIFEKFDEYYTLDAQQTMNAGYIFTYRKIYQTVKLSGQTLDYHGS